MLTCSTTTAWGEQFLLRFAGHCSNLPADQEERRPGRPEDGPGEGQRSSARPRQRVGQHTERRLLCSQTQRGEGGLSWEDNCCGVWFT